MRSSATGMSLTYQKLHELSTTVLRVLISNHPAAAKTLKPAWDGSEAKNLPLRVAEQSVEGVLGCKCMGLGTVEREE